MQNLLNKGNLHHSSYSLFRGLLININRFIIFCHNNNYKIMKKNFIYLSISLLISLITSCDEDEKRILILPEVSIESASGDFSVAQEDTLTLKANIVSPTECNLRWTVNGDEASTDSVFKFIPTKEGDYDINLTAMNADGEKTATAKVSVYGKYQIFIESLSGDFSVAQEDTLALKAKLISPAESKLKWTVNGVTTSTDSIFNFVPSQMGNYEIILTASNIRGEKTATTKVDVYGKYRDGTFILSEGSAYSGKPATLTFISPKGIVTDSAFYKENGTMLGGVGQDVFIANNKIYIICQNGKLSGVNNEGNLIIANAETLKKAESYDDEINNQTLSWPTHIAVTGTDNLFIRDNKGVYLFNTSTKKLTFIKGTEGATKNTMAVVGDKVFVPCAKNVLVLQADKVKEGEESVVAKIEFPGKVSGVIKSSDGNVWVSCSSKPAQISKISSTDFSIIKTNDISDNISVTAGVAAASGITAKGDTLYFCNLSTTIYRHLFATNETKLMANAKDYVQDANIVYNTVAVHPITGEVYINTLKGFGQLYLENYISAFNFEGNEPKVTASYFGYTKFPAGVFFTYNYR